MVLPRKEAQFWRSRKAVSGGAVQRIDILVPLALTLSLLTATPPVRAADPYRQSPQIPLEVYDGYLLVVEGNIGARHGLKFLLDTGATHSTVDRKLAEDIGTQAHRVRIVSGDTVISIDEIRLPQISLGPLDAKDIDVTVADLSYLRRNGATVDAIIGLDLLSERNFLLDLAEKRVVFTAAPGLPSHAPLRVDAISLQIQVQIDGHSAWMIADTGTPGVVFFEDRLSRLNVPYRTAGRIVGASFGGAVDSRIAWVPSLRVSGQDLDRRVYLTATPQSGLLSEIAGYFGIASLHARQIAFDFEKHELRWAN